MKSFVFAVLALAVVGAGLFYYVSNDGASAQSTMPPRVFQTEVRSWLTDDSIETADWTFTYLNDGSLHLVTPSTSVETCPSFNVPEGVFVSAINKALATSSQPGTGEPVEICEAFFTRANG